MGSPNGDMGKKVGLGRTPGTLGRSFYRKVMKKVIAILLVVTLAGCFGSNQKIPVPDPGYAIVTIVKHMKIQDNTEGS